MDKEIEKFRKEIIITPAYDKRDSDPKKNYGISAAKFNMYLIGSEGAIHFTASTGWFLPELRFKVWQAEQDWNLEYDKYLMLDIHGYDVGYHSHIPRYEGQTLRTDCKILGGNCYYDGSALEADKWADIIVKEGSDKIWKKLEAMYADYFGDK